MAGGSALDVIDTISRSVGSFDPSLVLPYLSDTNDGNAVLARVAIVALLLWLGIGHRRPAGADRAAFVTLGLALLMTFSLVSHAGAQPGVLQVAVDLAHLIGVTGWAGALVYGAWLLPWHASDAGRIRGSRGGSTLDRGVLERDARRCDGRVRALNRLGGPGALTETPYGLVLLVKLAAVTAVASVAAVNRWVLIPSLARGATAARLGGLVKVESLLILTVLGVTAVLVAQSPPGPLPTLSRPLTFHETTGRWMLRGTLEPRDPGRFAIELEIQDPTGAPVPTAGTVDLTLTMLDMEMPPVTATLAEVRPGVYQGTFFLPTTGQWQMAIHAGGSTVRVPLQTEATMFIQSLSPWRMILPGIVVVLVGMGFAVDGLRRMGAGVRGSWPEVEAGTAFVIIGVVLALRAVS